MIEIFAKWFYLIGSIVLAISMLIYFLHKAKTLSPNGKSENESLEFYWSLIKLVAFHALTIILGTEIVRESNHNKDIWINISFLCIMLIFLIVTIAISYDEIINDYIKRITKIRQNQIMQKSIKI
jgi:hypothetical protein